MTPDLLARSLQEFLAESLHGVVMEEGQIIFDLDAARYSVSADRGRCLLHIWSPERNIVREVLDSELKNGTLRLAVCKFAQSRSHKLMICRERDQRTPAIRKAARTHYSRLLERVLLREFPGWTLHKLSTSMDLERSFSPVYTRALLRKGCSSLAVLGVNAEEEAQSSVDAALTFGLLWLDHCRQREAGKSTVEGLILYVPHKRSATLRIRMAHLNAGIARFRLYELEERDLSIEEKELGQGGDLETRLQRCPDIASAHAHFADAIARVRRIVPSADVVLSSPGEIAFRLHGLEFARARIAAQPASFQIVQEIIFGVARFEMVLAAENETVFAEFAARIARTRQAGGDRRDAFWRMYPERWLESLIIRNVSAVDARLDSAQVYSQVPAFSASDRSLIDVVTCTRQGRLAVLELKADEDIHLPAQGLDYWARVLWHHAQDDFQKYGYFHGAKLLPDQPLLFLVAPSLRVHPAVETVLRYFSPSINWTLVGLDERWREGVRVVFRKSSIWAASA